MVESLLRIAAELENLKEIRRFIRETGAALGADAGVIADVVRAADEAACNIITHGYQLEGGVIEVEVQREGNDLLVRLRDQAPPFDPTRVPAPDLSVPLEQRRPGGLGIYIVRQAVDQMLHCVTPQGGNELTLIKHLQEEKEMTMEITVTQAQGRVPVTVLQPHGELDASNYKDLIAKAQQAYEAGPCDILLDLSDVPYMSSSGLVALHRIAVMLRGQDVTEPESGWEAIRAIRRDVGTGLIEHFKLVNAQPDVNESLTISGFTHFIEVHADFEAAVASF